MTNDVFAALSNPVRRRILEHLREGARSTTDLAGEFEVGRPAVSEHLAVLRSAGLVREEPRGRHRFYHLEAARLVEVGDWLAPFERYWRERMRDLADFLDAEHADRGEGSEDEHDRHHRHDDHDQEA